MGVLEVTEAVSLYQTSMRDSEQEKEIFLSSCNLL